MTTEVTRLSCGHDAAVSLRGNPENRTRKRAWYQENGVCKACFKAEREAEITKLEEELGLPSLSANSDEQISYARDIRAGKIAEFLAEYEGEVTLATITRAMAERTKGSRVFFENTARFWLDAKGKKLNTLIRASKKATRRPKLALEQRRDPVHFAERQTVLYDLETDGRDPFRPLCQLSWPASNRGESTA